jgi:N-acetylglucosamine repressor
LSFPSLRYNYLYSLNKQSMFPTSLGNRDLIRAINRSIVLNSVKTMGPVARAEVARQTGLSPATVTAITADLIAEELIFEKQTGDSSGGRRPILLAINPGGRYVVGIKLMEDRAVGALTDLEATIIARQVAALPAGADDGHEPEAVLSALAGMVDGLLAQASVSRTRLLGVGLGLAGIVDSERGILRQSPFMGWYDLPVRDLLQAKVSVPVYIDNDVNTLTLAEKWFGAGQDVDDFLTITVGRGIGMGIVVNRQFYRGGHGGAGEFGHTVVDPDGPQCDCGKHGCLETFVGDPGLVRMANATLAQPVASVDELLQRAEAGDEPARAVFGRAGTILGRAVANLVNIFDPQRIIISGEGARVGKWLFDPMGAAVDQHVMPALRRDVHITIEPWGDDAWARGAASLVLRELFESPMHREPAFDE